MYSKKNPLFTLYQNLNQKSSKTKLNFNQSKKNKHKQNKSYNSKSITKLKKTNHSSYVV